MKGWQVTGPRVSFCPACGGVMEQRIPEGENELRAICSKCGCIHYQNPKMVDTKKLILSFSHIFTERGSSMKSPIGKSVTYD